MTTEQKLKAIIQAQCEGGYIGWKFVSDDFIINNNHVTAWGDEFSILEILLDPNGMEAAFTEEGEDMDWFFEGKETIGSISGFLKHIAGFKILDTWLSSNGDAEATIECAFNLLPKK